VKLYIENVRIAAKDQEIQTTNDKEYRKRSNKREKRRKRPKRSSWNDQNAARFARLLTDAGIFFNGRFGVCPSRFNPYVFNVRLHAELSRRFLRARVFHYPFNGVVVRVA